MYLTLIREGLSIRDKITILLYLLCAPVRYYFKLKGKEYSRNYKHDVTLKNKYGLFFCCRSFNSSRIVCSSYEKNMSGYFKLRKGVFVDVGSHIGKYSIAVANAMGGKGKVISIEPEPHNFLCLKKNVNLNRLTNISLSNLVCCDKDGDTAFYVHNRFTSCHSIYPYTDANKITAKASRLDTILRKLKTSRVDLIKIDVENAELDVLKGAMDILNKNHPKIIFEAGNEKYLSKIINYLIDFGYTVHQINNKNYIARTTPMSSKMNTSKVINSQVDRK